MVSVYATGGTSVVASMRRRALHKLTDTAVVTLVIVDTPGESLLVADTTGVTLVKVDMPGENLLMPETTGVTLVDTPGGLC